jgi:hypothetical protein
VLPPAGIVGILALLIGMPFSSKLLKANRWVKVRPFNRLVLLPPLHVAQTPSDCPHRSHRHRQLLQAQRRKSVIAQVPDRSPDCNVQDTWLGRVLNNFRWFEVSHLVMFIVLYAVLLVHPIPGLPKDHGQGRSVTWVRCRQPSNPVC